MTDAIATFGNSILQHGKGNDRVYLMKLSDSDLPEIVPYLEHLALTQGYTKIFAKVRASQQNIFHRAGYQTEATIPGFFGGEEDAAFLGRYFDPRRQTEKEPQLVAQVLEAARAKAAHPVPTELPAGYRFGLPGPEETPEMAALYREVFASYPFPVHDPDYLRQTMAENLAYFGIWKGGELVALSSAEMDRTGGNAEMTDFATLPTCRGEGLAGFLLTQMEAHLRRIGFQTAYTIARAYSFGMNVTFARGGYSYSGTLTHNTQISGQLESMNVWYKDLR